MNTMKRILVTGSKGMLGSELVEYLAVQHYVSGIDIDDVDITQREPTISKIVRFKPDLVIHTAAYTNVDGAESEVDIAYKVNAIGTQNVALGCQRIGAAMLYISTDYVFDGKKGSPYIEFDVPNPTSVYGKSKLAGEFYVKSLIDKFYIVRTAWLCGKRGNNFVSKIISLSKENKILKIVKDQIGSPTFVSNLKKEIARLIETSGYGIYHITNSGQCSWFEFTQEIIKLAKISGVEVVPITTEELARPAPRPAYSVLRNYCMELTIGSQMPSWQEGLKEYLS